MMFGVALAALVVCMAMALVRSVLGPTVFDRVLAVNSFGTKTVLLIAVVGFLTGRPDFLDLSLVYALMNFIGTIAVMKFTRFGDLAGMDQDPVDSGGGRRMNFLLDLASWFLLLGGSALLLIGALGLIRLPDFYSRVHAASITDSLGTWMILIGLALQVHLSLITVKIVMILFFMLLTSPMASHALTKAAYTRGLKPVGRDLVGTESEGGSE